MERKIGIRIEGDASGYVAATGQAATASKTMEEAQRIAAMGMQRMELSAKQYSQAMRFLPMQITDVTTSLASGMPVWMVAVQQGGQIKDSFGGAGNAARALAGALSPTTLAVGALGLAAAATAMAMFQGRAETNELYRAILLTGNAAGRTAAQLQEMARAKAQATGATQGEASGIAAALVSTGQVRGAQLDSATEASIRLQRSLGVEAEKTVQIFASLGKDPLSAAVRLNEQWNFLTKSTYEQIKGLTERGRTADSAAVAQEAFAKVGIERAEQMERRLGLMEKAWRGVAGAAKDAWDRMLDVGREGTLQQQIIIQQERLKSLPLERVTREGVVVGGRARAAAEARIVQMSQQLAGEVSTSQQTSAQAEALRAQAERDRTAKPRQQDPGVDHFILDKYDAQAAALQRIPAADVGEIMRNRSGDAAARAADRAGYDEQNRLSQENQRQAEQRRIAAETSVTEIAALNRRASAEAIQDAQERGRALIAIEEAELRKRVDVNALGASEIERMNEELATWRVGRERQLTEQLKPEWQRMVEAWSDANQQMKSNFDTTVMGVLREGENAFVRWAQTGKTSTKELVDFVIAQAARQAYQNFISQAIALGMRAWSNYDASNNNPNYSNEGNNYPAPTSSDDSAGIKRMSSASSTSSLPPVTIINQTGTTMQGSASRGSDGGIQILLTAAEGYMAERVSAGEGPLVSSMRGRFGLRDSFASA